MKIAFDAFKKDLGGHIRQRRLHYDMTMLRLAALTNLSKSMISQLENGKITPSLPSLITICGVLKINLNNITAMDFPKRCASCKGRGYL